ncbi:MAG: PINc/VapC family ATPase [Candidatus Aenigmatarchaeota archaeon]
MRRKERKPTGVVGKIKKIVPDTSAIIHGRLSKLIADGELDGSEIIIPEIVIGELQAQAARGKETGFTGIEEIKNVRELAAAHKISVRFVGERPSYEDILLAKSGRIDALIQDVAKKESAVLLTTDLPQALVADATGISVKYYEAWEKAKKIRLESFLTPDTMSLHLKEGTVPYAKRGRPGAVQLVALSDNKLTADDLEAISKEILDAAKYEEEAFIEYGEHGASVIQLKNLRIAITRPPFSDGLEITVVRPTVRLTLDDYKLSEKLKERLKKAEGILLAGPPGSGKSTFAASMAEFYLKHGSIVKTMECPRDLQVPDEVTQYAPLDGSFAKTADMLLLVRPDFVIFDEIRKTKDFEIFADMRLAGIGLVGVVHATAPVDAIQRFIGRVELGVIPHIVDTVIFIKYGAIEKVLNLALTVRVPSGMTEADLARPVVEVRDFETGKLEYEIYTYGEQTVVVPVIAERKPAVQRLAADRVLQEIRRYDPQAEVEMLSEERVIVRVRNDVVPKLIGKEGKTIKAIEQKLGINIEIEPITATTGKSIAFDLKETGGYMVLYFSKKMSGKIANVYVDNEYLFTATIGRKGDIKVSKSADIGKALLRALVGKRDVKVFI